MLGRKSCACPGRDSGAVKSRAAVEHEALVEASVQASQDRWTAPLPCRASAAFEVFWNGSQHVSVLEVSAAELV